MGTRSARSQRYTPYGSRLGRAAASRDIRPWAWTCRRDSACRREQVLAAHWSFHRHLDLRAPDGRSAAACPHQNTSPPVSFPLYQKPPGKCPHSVQGKTKPLGRQRGLLAQAPQARKARTLSSFLAGTSPLVSGRVSQLITPHSPQARLGRPQQAIFSCPNYRPECGQPRESPLDFRLFDKFLEDI